MKPTFPAAPLELWRRRGGGSSKGCAPQVVNSSKAVGGVCFRPMPMRMSCIVKETVGRRPFSQLGEPGCRSIAAHTLIDPHKLIAVPSQGCHCWT
eukprot:CAMPEP_0119299062 /NCGR_PEP_ID=MMETSP1333-20130426/1177_1 /TAXON_ID=418940 /ORGANISM="Scyphosphaera apsteinii, Strain RCC1455" /LENGTH=94 /DNA_ID=CAMNT_0007300355 /DNA_START=1418 /DNA_END=1702 /DNA_ORIENTATION=-